MKTKRFLSVGILIILGWLTAAPHANAFYNPSTGRWLTRDLIDERGGKNLCAFWENDAINNVDAVGLQGWIVNPPPNPINLPPVPPLPPLQPNQGGIGDVHHSRNSIALSFSGCCNCDEILERIYGGLKSFSNWGDNSVASLDISGNVGSFYPGAGVSIAGNIGANNDPSWSVRLSNDDSSHCVSARTLDNHPLVGVRKWCASLKRQGTTCIITITTEAYERTRNLQNSLGMSAGPGRRDQSQIWEEYLGNIANAYTGDACFRSSRRGNPVQHDTGSTDNPFLR